MRIALMSEIMFYNDLLIGFLLTGAEIFPLLFFIDAPYGRYFGQPWQGPAIDNRLGWIFMEAPAAIVFALCFIAGEYHHTLSAYELELYMKRVAGLRCRHHLNNSCYAIS